jgi:magnesium chelatase subunit I
MSKSYPLQAIIGQCNLVLALLLNAVDPLIGGVMVMGDRGTGKSTAIRALVDVLPYIRVVPGDACNGEPKGSLTEPEFFGDRAEEFETVPVPLVELPLGATEDRVCGSIDVEAALEDGVKAFEPGLLARANRGFLYVDEMNLLEDHLVDVLLDAAASGWNTVERDGMSIGHPARFVLVGSGNPEEGELRPQLLDRFGMYVEVKTVSDPAARVLIARLRARFDRDPDFFCRMYEDSSECLRNYIGVAGVLAGVVSVPEEIVRGVSSVCVRLNVDGVRGDIVVVRASKALAALVGEKEVKVEHVEAVLLPCLRHRVRAAPGEGPGDAVKKAFSDVFGDMPVSPDSLSRIEDLKKILGGDESRYFGTNQ